MPESTMIPSDLDPDGHSPAYMRVVLTNVGGAYIAEGIDYHLIVGGKSAGEAMKNFESGLAARILLDSECEYLQSQSIAYVTLGQPHLVKQIANLYPIRSVVFRDLLWQAIPFRGISFYLPPLPASSPCPVSYSMVLADHLRKGITGHPSGVEFFKRQDHRFHATADGMLVELADDEGNEYVINIAVKSRKQDQSAIDKAWAALANIGI
jgi:hypothetical protein